MRRVLAYRGNRSFNAGGIEIILLLVVIRRCRNHCEIDIRICFLRVDGGMEIDRPLTRGVLLQKIGDYRIDNRTFATVQQLDLLRNDVKGVNLVMLGKQQCDGQSNVTGSCDRDPHNASPARYVAHPLWKILLTGNLSEFCILQISFA